MSDAPVAIARPAIDAAIETMFEAFRPQMDVPAAAWDLTIGQLRLMILIRRSGAQSMRRVAESFQLSQTAARGWSNASSVTAFWSGATDPTIDASSNAA